MLITSMDQSGTTEQQHPEMAVPWLCSSVH